MSGFFDTAQDKSILAATLLATRRRGAALADPSGAWFRNVGKLTCGYCEFAALCLSAVRIDPGAPAAGYGILDDVHPELTPKER